MTREKSAPIMHTVPAPPAALASQGTYPNSGSTFVAPLPEDAYYATTPGRMRLSHDGNHWTGQFQRALIAILTDQLSDGPLSVYVSTRIPGCWDTFERVSGTLTSVDAERDLVFEDGFRIAAGLVMDIEF